MKSVYEKFVMLVIRWHRVGSVEGIGISDLRDRDGQFYRAAYGAVDWIRKFAPRHLRPMEMNFKWIVNRRLASGSGSSWHSVPLGVLWVDFHKFNDELTSMAYLACYLVGESVACRFPASAFTSEAGLLRVLRFCNTEEAKFALNFNVVRDGLGDLLHNAIKSQTDDERMNTSKIRNKDQLFLDICFCMSGRRQRQRIRG